MIRNAQQITDAASIVEVISEFVSLKKKGVNYTACCPFHTERTPSFSVSPVKGLYKCFGCGKSGNAVNFMMEHEGMTYPEALRFLAKKFKIELQEDQTEADPAANLKRESLFAVNKWAAEHYQQNYYKSSAAQEYVKKRKLEEAVTEFMIGWAEPGNELMSAAATAGYSTEILHEAGLIKQNDHGSYYDAFNRRLIFPFFDKSGRIIGFTGRLLTEEKDKPKYLHTAETEIFKKPDFLYGLYKAKREIISKNECYLTEGQTDVISMHLAGVKNVVAGSGTSLSDNQVRMIRNLAQDITIIYDDDKAGISAAIRNVDPILKAGVGVYVIVLPKGEDPDSFARTHSPEEIQDYLEKNRTDFITFRIGLIAKEKFSDLNHRKNIVKDLVQQVSLIPDYLTRSVFLKEIASQLKVSLEDIEKESKKLVKVEDKPEKGFFGLNIEDVQNDIKEKDEAILLQSPELVLDYHSEGKTNTIGLPDGKLDRQDIWNLQKLTKNIIIDEEIEIIDEHDNETELAYTGRVLTEKGCRVILQFFDSFDVKNNVERATQHDFFEYYAAKLAYKTRKVDSKGQKKYIEMVAEFMSKLDNTIITIKINDIAKSFGLTLSQFNKVLKDFVAKKKNLVTQHQSQVVIDDEQHIFDMNRLPDYVDQHFLNRYQFFPAQDKTGQKLFYVFKTLENTALKVANFYMEPLFQVYDPDPIKNKRIVKLYHADLRREEYVEFKSADMIEIGAFKKFLWGNGGYLFTNGKQYHHEKILESISLQFPKCYEFSVFGWQPEGFFAFSNGIVSDGNFTHVDELGLIKFKNEMYYSPAFSKIYVGQRADNDKYEYDRYLAFRPQADTDWKTWTNLLVNVFKYNNNGMWALLFTILSAHRSAIFQIDRLFTSLFFIGPTESGKSKVAESIRAPFMAGAPLFNLNSGTDAAFFTTLERFRDIPVVLEEYNDYQISDVKFQGLKAAVYDNEGKQKRKDATSKDIDVSKVNCSPVLLGQEAPERDDGSLANRVVLLHVPKKDDWSDEEVNMFKDLKDRERAGLSNIAVEIINRRKVINEHFAGYMRQLQKEIKADITATGGTFQTRIINTVSLFLACCKLWEEHVKELPLPFTFEEFYKVAMRQIIKQSEDISSSNRLAIFFDTISLLYTQGQIITGREFDIVECTSLSIQVSRNEIIEKKFERKKVLFLIVNNVQQLYQKLHGSESLKLNALRNYLKDHASFIGNISSHRFSYNYTELVMDPMTGRSVPTVKRAKNNTSCIALDYEVIRAMGVDLEKEVDPTPVPGMNPPTFNNPSPTQPEIDFDSNDQPPF